MVADASGNKESREEDSYFIWILRSRGMPGDHKQLLSLKESPKNYMQ